MPEHNKGAVLSAHDEFRQSSDRWPQETGLALDDSAVQKELQQTLAELDETLDCVREHGTGSDQLRLYMMSENDRTLAMLGALLARDIEQP